MILVSSTAGQRGEARHSHYAASKGAVISLTKSLAPELAPHGILVNCIAPGWFDTDMSRPCLRNPRTRRDVLTTIPLRRVGRPEEFAGCRALLGLKSLILCDRRDTERQRRGSTCRLAWVGGFALEDYLGQISLQFLALR